ncbi:MAG: GNAT family N-acetyltransferase [Streptococcaceae bacterium]|jgi:ribosomal protein S18 acetylase RimI-like enzyme|nr:GNAT family N-acetyltransferase [Streptococcaceae bacterium]
MTLKLIKAHRKEAEKILALFQPIFRPYLAKYHDDEINPANLPIERIESWFDKPHVTCYFIANEKQTLGFIQLVHLTEEFEGQDQIHIGNFGILPEFQNQGLGQACLRELEKIYQPKGGWLLSTILQEAGNRHLYEKFGYRRAGKLTVINDKMTIIEYEKGGSE